MDDSWKKIVRTLLWVQIYKMNQWSVGMQRMDRMSEIKLSDCPCTGTNLSKLTSKVGHIQI